MRVPAAPSMLEGGWVMLVADGRTGREVCAGVQAAGAVTVLMWLWRIFDACYGEQVFRETRNPRCMALQHPLDTRFNTTEAGLAGCAAGNDRTRWKGRNLRRWIMLNCITLFFFSASSVRCHGRRRPVPASCRGTGDPQVDQELCRPAPSYSGSALRFRGKPRRKRFIKAPFKFQRRKSYSCRAMVTGRWRGWRLTVAEVKRWRRQDNVELLQL